MEQLVVLLAVGLTVFIICREIVCWYWKVNEVVELMKIQIDILNDIKFYMINKKEKQDE